jgi:Na+/melibiose symporter-like transporter
MLMFMIPHGFPIWGQIVWITISYILWDTSYTLCDIPIYGLPTVMTGNQDERALILSNGRLSSSLCYNFAIAAIPLINGILRDALGFEFSYEIVISLFCAISLLLMIPIVKHAKERTVVKVEKPISFKEMGKYLFKNKYLLLYFLSYIVMGVLGVSATFALHLGRYLTPYMDNYQMYSGIVALVPFVIIAFFLPKLIKKYDKFKLYFWSLIIGVFLQIISFFVGYTNVWVFWVMYVLRTLPSIFTGILAFMFTGDLAEYGLYKTGNDASGCAFAVQTFSAKLTGSLAGSIALLILTGINFVEGSPVDGIPVIQPDGFNNALWAANIFVPVLGMALAVIPLLFYHLRDYKVQIMAAANRDLITREESDELLKLSRSAYLKIHEARILKLISESNQQTNPANTEVAHDTQTE